VLRLGTTTGDSLLLRARAALLLRLRLTVGVLESRAVAVVASKIAICWRFRDLGRHLHLLVVNIIFIYDAGGLQLRPTKIGQ
jgi:hypothetical protein